MVDYRSSPLFRLWGMLYTSTWGGLKRLFLPNTKGFYRILFGPGKGIRIVTNPAAGGTRVLLGRYEPCLMKWLARTIKPGNVIYDIGSANGHEALIAARLAGPNGRVFAFEPDEEMRKEMQTNLEANPDLARRIQVLPFFVGDQHDPAERKVTVDAIGREHIPPPDVVKMDVEGMECEVLAGMEQLARTRCPHTFVECHLGPHIAAAVRHFFCRHAVPVKNSSPSLFEVSRRGYNTWVWTERQ